MAFESGRVMLGAPTGTINLRRKKMQELNKTEIEAVNGAGIRGYLIGSRIGKFVFKSDQIAHGAGLVGSFIEDAFAARSS